MFLGPLFLFCVLVGVVAGIYFVRGDDTKAEDTLQKGMVIAGQLVKIIAIAIGVAIASFVALLIAWLYFSGPSR